MRPERPRIFAGGAAITYFDPIALERLGADAVATDISEGVIVANGSMNALFWDHSQSQSFRQCCREPAAISYSPPTIHTPMNIHITGSCDATTAGFLRIPAPNVLPMMTASPNPTPSTRSSEPSDSVSVARVV